MKFKITYLDPTTEEIKVVFEEFHETFHGHIPNITALEWAEDCAYGLADKGYYKVEEET